MVTTSPSTYIVFSKKPIHIPLHSPQERHDKSCQTVQNCRKWNLNLSKQFQREDPGPPVYIHKRAKLWCGYTGVWTEIGNSLRHFVCLCSCVPVEDAEYMFMSCPSGAPNNDLRETQLSGTGTWLHFSHQYHVHLILSLMYWGGGYTGVFSCNLWHLTCNLAVTFTARWPFPVRTRPGLSQGTLVLCIPRMATERG